MLQMSPQSSKAAKSAAFYFIFLVEPVANAVRGTARECQPFGT
jgi:hypothetical protein